MCILVYEMHILKLIRTRDDTSAAHTYVCAAFCNPVISMRDLMMTT